jgi:hypothetical protein
VDLLLDPADDRQRLAEVDLGVPRRMMQRHEHLAPAVTLLAHVVLHDRVVAGIAVLGAQSLEDPLRRMPLLGRRRAIRLQDLVNGGDERVELRSCRGLAAPIARRHRKAQHLRHRLWIDAEPTRCLTPAHALHLYRSPNPRVELHLLHPSAFCPPEQKAHPVTEFYAAATGLPGRFT